MQHVPSVKVYVDSLGQTRMSGMQFFQRKRRIFGSKDAQKSVSASSYQINTSGMSLQIKSMAIYSFYQFFLIGQE